MKPKPLDLSQFSDIDVLRIVRKESPEFVDIMDAAIKRGWTDDHTIFIVCDSGGSPQAMRYAKKILNALRSIGSAPASEA